MQGDAWGMHGQHGLEGGRTISGHEADLRGPPADAAPDDGACSDHRVDAPGPNLRSWGLSGISEAAGPVEQVLGAFVRTRGQCDKRYVLLPLDRPASLERVRGRGAPLGRDRLHAAVGCLAPSLFKPRDIRHGSTAVPPPPRVTFRRVVVSLRGPGQSPVLPFACCVGSLLSVGRCGRCSCWCRFRVRGAQWLVCWGCAGCRGMCRLRVSGAQ